MRNFSRAPSLFPHCHYRASVPSVLIRHVGYSYSLRSSFLRAIVICFNYGGYSSSLPFSWVLVFPPSIPYSLDFFFFNSPKLALLNSNALIGLLAFWLWVRSHQVSEMPTKAKLPCISAYLWTLTFVFQTPFQPRALPFTLLKLLWQTFFPPRGGEMLF